MKHLQNSVKASVKYGENSGYVAYCSDIAVVTQANTIDETVKNIQEAVSLFFENENLNDLGFTTNPSIIITFETDPVYA